MAMKLIGGDDYFKPCRKTGITEKGAIFTSNVARHSDEGFVLLRSRYLINSLRL